MRNIGQTKLKPPTVLKRWLACLIVMAVAALLLLRDLGAIGQPVWDESYYLATTARYHLGRLQFASHPPLGLMLIAAGDRLAGWNAEVDWRAMAALPSVAAAQLPAGFDLRGPRIASALFGVCSAGLFFLLMRDLLGKAEPAVMLSLLFLADPALLVQWRAGHLDAFQLCFGLGALLAARGWWQARDGAWRWAMAAGACVAAAALVRLNGVGLAVMLPAVAILRRGPWQRRAAELGLAGMAALAVVAAVYAAHLAASPWPPDATTRAGQRDAGFVSPAYAQASNLPERILAAMDDQRKFMASDLATTARSDPNGSHPWNWPLGLGAITYRWDADADQVWVLALIPNRIGWWLSSFGVLGGVWLALFGRRFALVLLAVWGAQMGGFLWLDGQRVLYLYHYGLALVAGYGLLALLWREGGMPLRWGWGGLALGMAYFAFIAPVALHRASSVNWCALVAPDCGPFSR